MTYPSKITIALSSMPTIQIPDWPDYTGQNGMYMMVKPQVYNEGFQALCSFITEKFPCPVPPSELVENPHITLMWSEKALEEPAILSLRDSLPEFFEARSKYVEFWPGHDEAGYLTLQLDSPSLSQYHVNISELGAKHSFDEFNPHLTIAKNIGTLTTELEKWMVKINNILSLKPLTFNLSDLHLADLKA